MAPALRTPASPPPTGSNHDRLAATGVPVFYIVGEHDAICPPDMIEMCHRLVSGSRYEVIAGAGHSTYFEKPQAFNQAVLRFLRQPEAPTSGRPRRRIEVESGAAGRD